MAYEFLVGLKGTSPINPIKKMLLTIRTRKNIANDFLQMCFIYLYSFEFKTSAEFAISCLFKNIVRDIEALLTVM